MADSAQIIEKLKARIAAATSQETSAAAFIHGIPGLIANAVEAAMANGATAEELAPFDDLNEALNAATEELQAAMLENT